MDYAMITVSSETHLPGSRSRQKDQALFADIMAADWLSKRGVPFNRPYVPDAASSGSALLDDILAMGAVNAICVRDVKIDAGHQMAVPADPVFLKWGKSVGWIRSGKQVPRFRKTTCFRYLSRKQGYRSAGTGLTAMRLDVPAAPGSRWITPLGPVPPTQKVARSY